MSRTERKVSDLVEDDPGMADAIRAVRDRAEQNGGGVVWSDVEDVVSSGHWGRLIQEGVIVNDGEGFVVDDPEAVERALDGGGTGGDEGGEISLDLDFEDDADEDDGDSSWSTADKAAGAVALAMMAGYYFGPVRNLVGGTMDLLLGPIDAALPFYGVILVLALFTGTYSALLQSRLMDTEMMEKYQERVQAVNEKKEAAKERGDDEALERIQQKEMEMMSDSMGMMTQQFRPMVWIMLFTIPLFLWMYWVILSGEIAAGEATVVLPLIGETEWQEGIVGPMQAWIVWYFLCSVGLTQIIRKAVDISPTTSNA